MKRVININFQGRVIPIEESAYDILKQYVEALRRYFANEEGREEIINDIESRIGELFAERLKAGASCITDDDVQVVIANIGRPEDFEAQGADAPPAGEAEPKAFSSQQRWNTGRSRLYRNQDDKIIAGVCSGLANYLGIDPIVVRIAFILLGGALFWIYFLLWVVVPSRSLESSITKRLYRNGDDKMIAGVASGLATYLKLPVWVPRLIFSLPFILGLFSNMMNLIWFNWDFDFVPRMISGSLGSTMFIAYLILWITVPVANTAAEKLEMRGARVDLNSIANTVKEDLEQFRGRAEKWGGELRSSAKSTGNGLARVIQILVKAVLIFIFITAAIALFGIFMALLFTGTAFAPLQTFLFEGGTETILAWANLFLVFLLPIIGLIVWAIRRLNGVRSQRHGLRYTFLSLWIIGLISGIMLVYMVVRDFRHNVLLDEEKVAVVSGAHQTLYIDVDGNDWKKYKRQFLGINVDDDFPWYSKGTDSIMVNTVRMSITKSRDSSFHVYLVKGSRGRTEAKARNAAGKISFLPLQSDSLLLFPQGFTIGKDEKFRNQRVRVVVEVPVGKKIHFSRSIRGWDWMEFNKRRAGDFREWEQLDNLYTAYPGEYIMQENGRPRAVNKSAEEI